MALQLIITEDGSHTIQDDHLNEIYHSSHGAVQESRHVFLRAGYEHIMLKFQHLNILEVGFGTGLNAWLTSLECLKKEHPVRFVSLEPFPIAPSIYQKLNYPDLKACQGEKRSFLKLHESPWQTDVQLHPFFNFKKEKYELKDFNLGKELFHLVYFDAFSPEIQPELWTQEIFIKIYQLLEVGGVLVTYSAKGQVRRNLQMAGFRVERLSGPPGKREMLRATKSDRMDTNV